MSGARTAIMARFWGTEVSGDAGAIADHALSALKEGGYSVVKNKSAHEIQCRVTRDGWFSYSYHFYGAPGVFWRDAWGWHLCPATARRAARKMLAEVRADHAGNSGGWDVG